MYRKQRINFITDFGVINRTHDPNKAEHIDNRIHDA
jgi:hypothetical protein